MAQSLLGCLRIFQECKEGVPRGASSNPIGSQGVVNLRGEPKLIHYLMN
jgi:hypothetical protein